MSNQEKHKINFFIDKEKFETDQAQLSVRTLLVDFAKEDPTQTTLALRHGNDIDKFTNLDQSIAMENGMHFIVFHNTPTPVS
jgi:translation elongation factor EF-Tu-like GTPase